MSFFDEATEPRQTRTPRPRRTAGPRRPSGGGGGGDQNIATRRLIAAGGAIVVIILVVLLVKGCLDSQKSRGLKDYARGVSELAQTSTANVQSYFKLLNGAGSKQRGDLSQSTNGARVTADQLIDRAGNLDVPGGLDGAQHDFLLALQLRREAMSTINKLLPSALGATVAKDAVTRIAAYMREFDAADVVVLRKVNVQIAQQLAKDNIKVGGADGEPLAGASSFPGPEWLTPNFVATTIGASGAIAGTQTGKPAPGLHGHSLDKVTVGGKTLQTSGVNRLTASPPPIFTVDYTNGGEHDEQNVTVRIQIKRAGSKTETTNKILPITKAGAAGTAAVALGQAPPKGTPVDVTVTVVPVPGEKDGSNNTLTFPTIFG